MHDGFGCERVRCRRVNIDVLGVLASFLFDEGGPLCGGQPGQRFVVGHARQVGVPPPVFKGVPEASTLLALADSGSIPLSSSAASLAEKVRKALLLTGFDPQIEIHIFCTEEERDVLDRLRERRGGFSSSC